MSTSYNDLLVQHHGSLAIKLVERAIDELVKSQDCSLRSQIQELEDFRAYAWEVVQATRKLESGA